MTPSRKIPGLASQGSSAKIERHNHNISFSGDHKAYILAASEPVELSLWNSRALEAHCEQFVIQHTIKTSNIVIFLFPMNDKEAFDKLPLLAEQYNFMTESQRLLVGWRPHADGGSELDGADGKTKVTAKDIKNFDKKLLIEDFYEIQLGGDLDALCEVVRAPEGFRNFQEKEQLMKYLEGSNISRVVEQIVSFARTSFDCHLSEMLAARKRKPNPTLPLECVTFLKKNGYLTSQIFCLPGDESQQIINSVFSKFSRGKKVGLEKLGVGPHTVADLLKKYLRSEPESILTSELYSRFLTIAEVPKGFRKTIVDALFSLLPTENRFIFLSIVELLGTIVENQERTHVDSLQLARVMAPCMLQRNSSETDGQNKMTQVMQLFIENSRYLTKVWLPTNFDISTCHTDESGGRLDKSLSHFFSAGSKESIMRMASSGRRRSFTKSTIMMKLRKIDSYEEDKKNIAAYSASHTLRDSDKGILPEHRYARDGQLEELRKSLNDHPFLSKAKDDLGNTLLHYATMGADGSSTRCVEIAEFLLDREPSLQFMPREGDGKTPLHVAIDCGRSGKQLVRMFMERIREKESELTRRTRNGKTVLHYAARNDCLESVTLLASCLSSRLSTALHLQDSNGCTPLHYAVRNDNFGQGGSAQQSQLVFLIRKLASPQAIEARDVGGQTPLHYAVQRKGEAVRLIIPLLATGYSTLLAADTEGRTPLHVAVLQNSGDAVDQLLKAASSLGLLKLALASRDAEGRTCLHYAARQHMTDLVGRVVGDEEIANLADFQGFTALHLASQAEGNSSDSFDQIQVLSVLATNSSSINSRDKWGRTPLHYATSAEEVQCLCSLGAIIDVEDFEGRTPFHLSVEEERMVVATSLRSLGASTEPANPHQECDLRESR